MFNWFFLSVTILPEQFETWEMRPVKLQGKAAPNKLLANNDRLKLIILAGFVLFVFWGGVAVGVGFSHGHEDHKFPAGGPEWIRNGRSRVRSGSVANPIETEDVPPSKTETILHVQPNDKLPTSGQKCCEGDAVECVACRQRVSVAQYCFKNPTHSGCDLYLPSSKSVFNGAYTFKLLEAPLDFESVTISVWIYLDRTSADPNMRTIVSNRASGCTRDQQHNGYALYVNEWATDDRSLNLMWQDRSNACAKLNTEKGVIEYEKWHHIGAIMTLGEQGQLVTKLFVDGQLKASSTTNEGRGVANKDAQFIVAGHTSAGDIHPFIGKIAHLAVVDGESEALASSYPAFYSPAQGDRVKAYFPSIVGEAPEDKSDSGYKLKRNKFGWSPDDVGGSKIDYLVPLGSSEDLAAGQWPRESFYLTSTLKEKSDSLGRERREVVKAAMKHAYGSYEKHAFGADELTPRSGNPKNNWGGMAMTMVDALDTLWIMGMKEEFYRARDYCRDRLRFDSVQGTVSTFETTIRALGGLMSAYDLSGEGVFLERAKDLGSRLAKAFSTTSGLPTPSVNLQSGGSGGYGNVVIAEVGTLQLEFRSLAYNAKEPRYAELAENVHKKMRQSPPADGLWPIYVNVHSGTSAGGVVTFGALGDSFFEYLLKIWVQGGKTEPEYLADYERAMDGVHKLVLQKSTPSGLMYLGDYNPGGHIGHKMDHLACFVPGMLALGVKKRGENKENEVKNRRDMTVAKALAYTCVQMYLRQPTGIAPEYVNWETGRDFTVPHNAPFYILRPETVESLYILHSITGHPVYRDWGHQIMTNIDRFCKVEHGYGALPDVRDPRRQPDDRMESFFLAETLKYLYLLQDPDSMINLDEWVFNTEAHPLKVMPPGWRQKIGLKD